MNDCILVHDIGIAGDRACVFNAEGQIVASAYAAYATKASDGIVEQEPFAWWQAVIDTTREILGKARDENVACVSVCGQSKSLVCLNKEGEVLSLPLIQGNDRAKTELRDKISDWDLYNITGHVPSEVSTLQKLRWLKANEPEIYQQTECVLQAKDYIVYKLTGIISSDFGGAAATHLFDIKRGAWSKDIIEAAGLNEEKLPKLRNATDIVGEVNESAARDTRLNSGIPVVAGATDAICASIGAGVARPGNVYNYIGASSYIGGLSEKPIFDSDFHVESSPHPAGGFLCGGNINAAGASYAWAADMLYGGRDDDRILYDLAAPRVDSVLFLPYLKGERDTGARGGFFGLSTQTTRGDMMRAVLEGVAMHLRFPLDALRKHFPIDDITLLGGGASNPAWNHIMADIYGANLYIMRDSETATAFGAAIIGGVGAGIFKDLGIAASLFATKRTVRPSKDNAGHYKELFELFKHSYAQIRETTEGLVALN